MEGSLYVQVMETPLEDYDVPVVVLNTCVKGTGGSSVLLTVEKLLHSLVTINIRACMHT